jgi:hypothetical protein
MEHAAKDAIARALPMLLKIWYQNDLKTQPKVIGVLAGEDGSTVVNLETMLGARRSIIETKTKSATPTVLAAPTVRVRQLDRQTRKAVTTTLANMPGVGCQTLAVLAKGGLGTAQFTNKVSLFRSDVVPKGVPFLRATRRRHSALGRGRGGARVFGAHGW